MTMQIKGLMELKMAGEMWSPYGSQCTFSFFVQVFRKRLLKRVWEKPNVSGTPWPHSKFQGRFQCFVSGCIKPLYRCMDLNLLSSTLLINNPRKVEQHLQVNFLYKDLNFFCIQILSSLLIMRKLMPDILMSIHL